MRGEVPFSSEWKWSGVSLDGGGGATYVLGAPDILAEAGRADAAAAASPRKLEEETAAGRRVVAFGADRRGAARRTRPPTRRRGCTPLALVVLEETLRPDARGDDRLHARAGGRPEADLRRRRGDRDRGRLRGRRAARTPASSRDRSCPRTARGWPRSREENTIFCRIKPEQKKALVAALVAAGRYVAMIGDGVNDVPALKRARMAVAMGSGSQVTKGVADVVLLKDQFSRLPRGGRRRAAGSPATSTASAAST